MATSEGVCEMRLDIDEIDSTPADRTEPGLFSPSSSDSPSLSSARPDFSGELPSVLTFIEASAALPFLTTSALINEIDTPEFREAMADIGESFEEMSSEDNLAVMSQTEISNLQVGRTDSGEPQISFEIKNNSERNLKYVRVDCEFFGNEGQAVYKTEFTPVSHWGAPAGSVEFLGSGETWFTEDNEFFKIKKSDLEEWDSVTVEVKIGSIEID